jgi:hypothetical protein
MSAIHEAVLYVSLLFLGLSLFIPGSINMLKPATGTKWRIATTVDAKVIFAG